MYNQIQSRLELLQQTQGLVSHYQLVRNGKQYYQGVYRYVSSNISPGDDVIGGFALTATNETATVYPFTLRLLCTNGAIRIHTEESIAIQAEDQEQVTALYMRFLEAMQPAKAAIYAGEDALALEKSQQYDKYSALFSHLMDIAENSLSAWKAFGNNGSGRQRRMLSRVRNTENQSAFDLINSITAAGRNEKDPVQKWALEQLGGTLITTALAWVEFEMPDSPIYASPGLGLSYPTKRKSGRFLEKERLF